MPRDNAHVTFACVYCKAVLGYNEPLLPLLPRLTIFVAGVVLLTVVQAIAGRTAARGILAAIGVYLFARGLHSSKPAYKIFEDSKSRVGKA